MIIDTSRILSNSISVRRMSEYLSLCKIDVLVRKVDNSTPQRRVDQPSKVGQALTMAKTNNENIVKPVLTSGLTLAPDGSAAYISGELLAIRGKSRF